MTDPYAPYRNTCATCGELDLLGDGDDLDDEGNCMDCVAAAVEEEPVEFDREMFDLRVRAEWEGL